MKLKKAISTGKWSPTDHTRMPGIGAWGWSCATRLTKSVATARTPLELPRRWPVFCLAVRARAGVRASIIGLLLLVAVSYALASPLSSQLALQPLAVFGFSDDGSQPGSLIQGQDGCLYGTSSGTQNSVLFTNGLVFKLSPSGEVTVLASFPPFDTNGFRPRVLAQSADGNFYGATRHRGPIPICGTIFRITPAGERTNIFWFGPNNGCSAQVLLAGSDGNLYGMARNIVFKLTTSGEFIPLHTNDLVAGQEDYTRTALLQGRDGHLYGAYESTVFRLTTDGVFTMLATVSNPEALVQGVDGNLYGTDAISGDGFGRLFRLTPCGSLSTLASFNGTNGWDAQLLISGVDGHLYGVTEYGGPDFAGWIPDENEPGDFHPSGSGTIFKVTLDGTLTTLAHSLPRSDGLSVIAMLQGSDGNLYLALESEYPGDSAGIFRLAPRPVITGVRHSDGSDVLSWTSFTGGVYQAEYKSTLSAPGWTVLSSRVTATASTVSATNAVGPSWAGWYRVRLLP